MHVDEDTFEAVPTFQYLGDVLENFGMQLAHASLQRGKVLGNYCQSLPIVALRNWGNIFSSCISKSLLYGCETWPASSKTIRCLTSADNGMVHWIYGVRLEQRIRTQELHEKLGIISVTEEI